MEKCCGVEEMWLCCGVEEMWLCCDVEDMWLYCVVKRWGCDVKKMRLCCDDVEEMWLCRGDVEEMTIKWSRTVLMKETKSGFENLEIIRLASIWHLYPFSKMTSFRHSENITMF